MWTLAGYLEDKGIDKTAEELATLEAKAVKFSRENGYKVGLHADENGFYILFETEVLEQMLDYALDKTFDSTETTEQLESK